MKAYSVAMYLFILNISFSLLANMQIFTMLSGGTADPIIFGYDQSIINGAASYANASVSGLDTIDMIGMIGSFFQAILNATFLLPFFLSEIGVPAFLNILIVAPVWYTYFAAIFQIATGRIMPLFKNQITGPSMVPLPRTGSHTIPAAHRNSPYRTSRSRSQHLPHSPGHNIPAAQHISVGSGIRILYPILVRL